MGWILFVLRAKCSILTPVITRLVSCASLKGQEALKKESSWLEINCGECLEPFCSGLVMQYDWFCENNTTAGHSSGLFN